MKVDKAKEVYENLLSTPNIDHTLVGFVYWFNVNMYGVNRDKTWKGDDDFALFSSVNYFIIFKQIYIQFMKFSRRSEGIKESRAVFKRAREDTRCCYHVGFKTSSYNVYNLKRK